MAKNELLSLNEMFNNKLFRIPDYQRGYAWEKSQLEDFWEDIMNLKTDGKHYTGLLTVEAIQREGLRNNDQWRDDLWLLDKGYKAYYVIDGQQRLTTAIVLLNVILDQYEEDDDINYDSKKDWQERFLFKRYKDKFESYIFGYEKDNPSNEFYKTYVLGQKSLLADKYPTETLYTLNLSNAKSLFQEKIEGLHKDELEVVLHKLINGLRFNFYEIDDELDVYVTFETMNNRGKPLSKLELLKNRLIYLSTLLEEDDAIKARLRSNINEVWKTIYEYLGKNTERRLDDDTFLKNHWIMYFKYDRSKANAFSNFLLNEYFTAKQVLTKSTEDRIGFQEIDEYITSLSKSVKAWYYMHNPKQMKRNVELMELLAKHNRIGWGAFEPLIMTYMIKADFEDAQLMQLLRVTERFVFLIFSITRRMSYTQNNNFYRLANELCYDRVKISAVVERIDRQIYYETEEFWDGWLDVEKFADHIQELFKKNDGYYSWNGLKYFLYEYEINLQQKNHESMKIAWETVRNKNSIEHIYPQEARKRYWTHHFKGYSKHQKRRLLNSLGNLLLLSQSKNSKLQNNGFDMKREKYKLGSHSEIEVSHCTDWTPEEVLQRGLRLLKFMEERWDIEIDNKKELLGLDFMKYGND